MIIIKIIQKINPFIKLLFMGITTTLFLQACATTNITHYQAEGFPKHTYTKIILAVDGANLNSQERSENWGVSYLKRNIYSEVEAWHQLFPPINKYTYGDYWKTLQDNGFDGVLIIAYQGGSSSLQSFLIPSTQTTTATATTGNTTARATTTSTSYSSYGYTIYQMSTGISFLDVKSKKTVWVGGANTSGLDQSSMNSSLGNEILKSLTKDGFLEKRPSKPQRR
ncbi:MAG: hypothetical protein IPJ69_05595 [Deltaproteobacteria bacterium]|nr:MAG: hypothetical protein IPJ69_05595 [Deltaproteobacteria bacterium]